MGYPIRLRQICLVAPDLKEATDILCDLFDLEICFRDEGVAQWGLENALMRIGNDFLEVVAPTTSEATAARYLQKRQGAGGYMVINQILGGKDMHDAFRAHYESLGVREMFRFSSPHDDYICCQLHPKDTGGAMYEIDWCHEWEDVDGAWHPAGPDWKDFGAGHRVYGFSHAVLQSADPLHLAENWARIIDRPLKRDGAQIILPFAEGECRFEALKDERGEGLSKVGLKVKDKDAILKAATRLGLPCTDTHVEAIGMVFELESAS